MDGWIVAAAIDGDEDDTRRRRRVTMTTTMTTTTTMATKPTTKPTSKRRGRGTATTNSDSAKVGVVAGVEEARPQRKEDDDVEEKKKKGRKPKPKRRPVVGESGGDGDGDDRSGVKKKSAAAKKDEEDVGETETVAPKRKKQTPKKKKQTDEAATTKKTPTPTSNDDDKKKEKVSAVSASASASAKTRLTKNPLFEESNQASREKQKPRREDNKGKPKRANAIEKGTKTTKKNQARSQKRDETLSPRAPVKEAPGVVVEDPDEWLCPLGSPCDYRCVLRFDAPMKDWVLSDDGAAVASELADTLACGDGKVSLTFLGWNGQIFAALDCAAPRWVETLDRVAALMEVKLRDLNRIALRMQQANLLESERVRIMQEIEDGLRCEFTLGYMAMQNLLLDGGARINEVKEMCEVDRVIVDTRKRTIRIVGRDAAEVSKARDMLEMAYETIENVPEMALRIIIGKGGSKVNDIKARTGAEISINFDKQSVFIRGRPSQVKSAKVLINSCIKTYEVEHVEVTYEDLDDVREELSRLQMEWGARPVQYLREGRGGRGGRGGLRMPAA